MPSEVHASVDLRLSRGQHRTVFRNPRGNKRFYAFYRNGNNLDYEWSTNGTTWTTTPITALANLYDSFDVKIHDDGSQLVVFVVAHRGDVAHYKRGTIGDSADTITFGSLQNVATSLTDIMSEPHCIAIARTDNAELVVSFTEDFNSMGKDYRRTKLIGSDGDGASPSWSGETTWDDPSTDGNNDLKGEVWFGLENYSGSVLSGNGVLLLARVPDPASTSTYLAASDELTWNGTTFGDVSATTVKAAAGAGAYLSLLIDESDFGHCLVWDLGTKLGSYKTSSAGSDNWGSATAVTADTIDACTLSLDTGPATDELYAFYHHTADSTDFHYKKTPVDTISWGSEQTITFSSDLIALTSWSRDVESSLHIGLEDADTDVWYHELVLAVPFIPELPFMINQTVNRASTY